MKSMNSKPFLNIKMTCLKNFIQWCIIIHQKNYYCNWDCMHLIDDLITVHCAHFKTCTNYWQTNEELHKKTPPFVKCFHYVIPDPRPNKLQRKFIVFLHVLQDFWLQHQSVTSWPASTFRGHLQTPTIKRLSFSDHLY